jgi:hypothetical protein
MKTMLGVKWEDGTGLRLWICRNAHPVNELLLFEPDFHISLIKLRVESRSLDNIFPKIKGVTMKGVLSAVR